MFMEESIMSLSTSDSAIGISPVDAVRNDVLKRSNGSICDLEVQIENGTLTLTGTTSRYYNKQLATSAVLDTVNELDLRNLIKVQTARAK
jgi:hypothetical protein